MHRVAERIEDGRHFLVDIGMMPPDVGHGEGDQLGKCACAIYAYALGVRAQVPPPGEAVAAAAAHHVSFAAYDVAGKEVVDVRADGDDLAHKFVPNCHGNLDGGLRPLVPLVDMNVGSADARVAHANQN